MASLAQRAANKRSRQKNWEKWNAYCRARVTRIKEANKAFFLEYLGGKCVRCENSDPRVLDFDHIVPGEKKNSIAAIFALANRDKIKEEVDKCQLLCANCHRIKSLENGDYKRRRKITKPPISWTDLVNNSV